MPRALAALGTKSPATIRSSPKPSQPGRRRQLSPGQGRGRRDPEPDGAADLVFFIFSLHHVPAGKASEARSARRGGCCGLRVASMWRNRWRKGRINLSWSYFMTKQPCAKPRPRRLPVLPDRISRPTNPDLHGSCGATPISTRLPTRMIANMRFNGYTAEAVLAPAVRRPLCRDLARPMAAGSISRSASTVSVRRVDAAIVAHRVSSCRSPDLARHFDDEPELGHLVVDRHGVAADRRWRSRIAGEANCSSGRRVRPRRCGA